jgi:hypothetical protein
MVNFLQTFGAKFHQRNPSKSFRQSSSFEKNRFIQQQHLKDCQRRLCWTKIIDITVSCHVFLIPLNVFTFLLFSASTASFMVTRSKNFQLVFLKDFSHFNCCYWTPTKSHAFAKMHSKTWVVWVYYHCTITTYSH